MIKRVIDLHCDLLDYLAEGMGRTPLDADSNCSLLQLKEGHVGIQVFAIFSETVPGSSKVGERQLTCFEAMLKDYPESVRSASSDYKLAEELIGALAIENGSAFLEEKEPLDFFFKRVERIRERFPLAYVGLTWNTENRFGGGCQTRVGLKSDGAEVLDYLANAGIAIDLSHASDQLAYDILDTIHKKGLALTPIASHSNYRAVLDVPRNIPDEFAREIFQFGGIVGLNFFRAFLGKSQQAIVEHLSHGLSLGGEKGICFGADFLGAIVSSTLLYPKPFYIEPFSNSSSYPELLEFLGEYFSEEQVKGMAFDNVQRFLTRTL